jgi:catechol 2,3-dioxygenase-like lactoylglutathione lyase family enzyme
MKRFHVHVNVNDLDANIAFYSRLFDATPVVVEADYAKWMLDDPRINFAISQRARGAGVDHLGLQVETGVELAEIGERLAAVDAIKLAEAGTTCCYAHSDKYWAEDPQGLRWETFQTHGVATTYYDPAAEAACCTARTGAAEPSGTPIAKGACCGPAAASATSHCG